MTGNATAAQRALRVLTTLAAAPGPMPASALARSLQMPRSSAYHLLAVMADEGFVVHYPDQERWGLGLASFEVGTAYLRHDPLEGLAQPLLRRLVAQVQRVTPVVGHLGILHGHETLYLLKEGSDRPLTLVTEVGVRLPAALTASGRAMLALLSRQQVRALFASRGAFVDRTGSGPTSQSALAALLAAERRVGCAQEDGFITPGFASVAAAVVDAHGRPVAAIGLTFPSEAVDAEQRTRLARAAQRCAADLSSRLGSAGPRAAPAGG